jgi:hypothetical protein
MATLPKNVGRLISEYVDRKKKDTGAFPKTQRHKNINYDSL